jgi:hypothetical protein
MQRAIGRAYQRLRGNHPRRPKSAFSLVIEISCDMLLGAAAMAAFAGAALLVWGLLAGVAVNLLIGGGLLLGAAAALLLAWEWLAWKSFGETLSELS